MALSLTDLFTPLTADQVMTTLLSVASTLGLDVTAWQAGQPGRTILRVVAQKIADTMSVIATMNQGGYLDYAALVTPEGGPGWLDLVTQSMYNTPRNPAAYAAGTVTLTNVNASAYSYAVGAAHFAASITGATYTNTVAGSISGANIKNVASSTNANPISITTTAPHGLSSGNTVIIAGHATNTSANGTWVATVTGASTYTIPVAGVGVGGTTGTSTTPTTASVTIAADVLGTGSTAAVGQVNTLVSSMVGVTCTNPASLVGVDPEKNAALVTRARAKLGSLSPLGPTAAYDYFARTIPPPAGAGVAVKSGARTVPVAPITRTQVVANASTGTVTTYVASATGTVPGVTTDVAQSLASSTNANPIAVTVTAHGYTTGDVVFIAGHVTNTAANGEWTITVTGANNFTIPATGNGVGVATGTVVRESDLDLVNKSIQSNAAPLAVTATTVSASNLAIPVTGVVYVTGATSVLADSTIVAAITTALNAYAQAIPVGGSPGVGGISYVYLEAVRSLIFGANPFTVNVTLSAPAADTVVSQGQVVTFGVPAITVTRV